MKHSLLCFISFFISFYSSSCVRGFGIRPAARHTEDSADLVAFLNGTIYLEDRNSGKVFWSFWSGSPVYSSYQHHTHLHHDHGHASGPTTGFFVDYGDDWQLYAHAKHSTGMSEEDKKRLLDLNKLVDCGASGRRIGKLLVRDTEIAKGSNGTVVLEGIYGGRPVAVKCLVQAHHDVAFKEIQNLIASDRHPNIVRWYGVEYDKDFVYLSRERCTCSLDDLMQICSDYSLNPAFNKDQSSRAATEYKFQLDSVKGVMQDFNFGKQMAIHRLCY